MTLAAPVRFSPSVEDIQPDEQETIAGLNDTFDTILETTAKDYGHAVRSVHAKAHGILEGSSGSRMASRLSSRRGCSPSPVSTRSTCGSPPTPGTSSRTRSRYLVGLP